MACNAAANPPVLPAEVTLTAGAIFQLNNAKLYAPSVFLFINNKIIFLENIKKGYLRTVSWSKYRSEMIAKPKDNSLGYMIDPTFKNVNRLLFVLSFKHDNDGPTRNFFDKYYMSLVEIEDFNSLIDN